MGAQTFEVQHDRLADELLYFLDRVAHNADTR